MREQEINAAFEELGILRSGREHKPFGCPIPLSSESLERLFKRNAQRLRKRAKGIVPGRTERDGECEFVGV